jgi:hypothetical protein
MGIFTVVALWFYYQLAKIMLERDRVRFQCINCGITVKSRTGLDRVTELQYAAHRIFLKCPHRSKVRY